MLSASSVYPGIISPEAASAESHPLGRHLEATRTIVAIHQALCFMVSSPSSAHPYREDPQLGVNGGKRLQICPKEMSGWGREGQNGDTGNQRWSKRVGKHPKNDFTQVVKSPASQKGTADCQHHLGALPASLLLFW